jgi:hypothetical protein
MGALLASLVHAEIDTELVAKSIDFMKRQTAAGKPARSRHVLGQRTPRVPPNGRGTGASFEAFLTRKVCPRPVPKTH